MFACLYKPDQPRGNGVRPHFSSDAEKMGSDPISGSRLLDVARLFSPRVEAQSDTVITLELDGLTRLFGDDKAIGDRLRRTAADAGLGPVHVGIAATRTTAILCAAARAGVTVVPAGEEAAVLAPLPLRTFEIFLPNPACHAEADVATDPRRRLATPKPPGMNTGEGGEPRSPRRRHGHGMPCPYGASLGSPRSSVVGTRAGLAASARSATARPRRSSTSEIGEPGVPRQSPVSGFPNPSILSVLSRWGIRTLGQLAALPAVELSERIGQEGLAWQRLACGEDAGPLVPMREDEPFEATVELEWPIEGLEPLSFVLGGLLVPLCQRLERRDRGAAVLHLHLRLVTKDTHTRSLQLPAPMRDAKVLRTLLLLDLESHQPPAGVDRVTVVIDPTPGRIVQESLLTRSLPAPEQVSTLLARLGALMGDTRCGSPALIDSHRPGAFAMVPFCVAEQAKGGGTHLRRKGSEDVSRSLSPDGNRDWGLGAGDLGTTNPASRTPPAGLPALREIEGEPGDPRLPSEFRISNPQSLIPNPGFLPNPQSPTPESRPPTPESRLPRRNSSTSARAEAGLPSACLRRFRLPIPARVLIDHDRPIMVKTDRPGLPGGRVHACAGPWRTSGEWWKTGTTPGASGLEALRGLAGWNRDEWDVALDDGGIYRLFEDRESGRWFVEAVVD